MTGSSRRQILASSSALAFGGLAGCLSTLSGGGSGDSSERAWRTIELETVRGSETFTIEELAADGPLLVETFAVWCSNCLRQQETLVDFHDANPDVPTIAVDIDQNEDASKVRQHANDHGFDWRYAVAPPEWTKSVTTAYGSSMANAPRVPMLRVCGPDDVTRLEDGHKSVSFLESKLAEC